MRIRFRSCAASVVAFSLLAACGGDDDAADEPADTEAPSGSDEASDEPTGTGDEDPAPETGESDGGSGWTVSTDDCVDPEAVTAPIEGTIKIGMFAALSGGPVVSAFQPVLEGYKGYIDFANEQGLLEGHDIELVIGDDQYNPSQTPAVVNSLLDEGVQLFGGGIGTANGLAVRELLDEECIPQLAGVTGAEDFGEVEDFPWTMSGINLTYPIEAKAFATRIAEDSPDGATVGVFYVNTELGLSYFDGFVDAADELGIEIVSTQTIEQADSAPPAAQVGEIARQMPDAIFAVPVGGNCPTFVTELANAKAATAGWEPELYIPSTCSSPAVLDAAGDAADGLFTATPGFVISDDSDIPEVQNFITEAASVGIDSPDLFTAAGWVIGEIVVETLRQAAASGELTRASIIEAARNMDFQPSVYRDGIAYRTNGVEDPIGLESVQIVQYDAAARDYILVGDLIDQYEG